MQSSQKDTSMLYPVIMAGGSGSRLWPLSRKLNPKQFLRLTDPVFSMLQETIKRLEGVDCTTPEVICNEEHRFLAAEQLRQLNINDAQILLEPVGRNTAPAIALAALNALAKEQNPLLLVLSADHLIQDVAAFHQGIKTALSLAKKGKLVTFGILPTHAEVGYGYIEKGSMVGDGGFNVARFVEKPDQKTAQSYLKTGNYLWNSGMFLFHASRYLEELQKFCPEIVNICRRALSSAEQDSNFIHLNHKIFQECPEDSVDYAVMEKTTDAVVVPLDAGWSDIGSWSALWEVGEKDDQGNICRGDVLIDQTRNSYIRSESRLICTTGVEDLVVIETKDAILVSNKNQVQDVKKVVEKLKSSGRCEHLNHLEVCRPWGMYDTIDRGERYQVKRITVKPGAKLSLQMHHHRAEHWVVVSGTAKVTNGEKVYLVTENQSTFIPIGQTHSLENTGVIPLELIEVQSGSYLGEDDIVRFEDRYGRK